MLSPAGESTGRPRPRWRPAWATRPCVSLRTQPGGWACGSTPPWPSARIASLHQPCPKCRGPANDEVRSPPGLRTESPDGGRPGDPSTRWNLPGTAGGAWRASTVPGGHKPHGTGNPRRPAVSGGREQARTVGPLLGHRRARFAQRLLTWPQGATARRRSWRANQR